MFRRFQSTITTLNSKQVWTTQTDSIWSPPPPALPFARRMTAAPGMRWESWVLEHSVTGAGSKVLYELHGQHKIFKYTHVREPFDVAWPFLVPPASSGSQRREEKESDLFFLSCIKSAPFLSSRTEPKAPSAEPASQLISAGSSIPRWFPKSSHLLHLHLTL